VTPLLLLLPGLDGTGELFAPFIAAAPPGVEVRALALPDDRVRTYPELAEWVCAQLPERSVVLLGESFSGPLAVLAAQRSDRVEGLVLSTTFVEPPLPRVFARCPDVVWSRPPPAFVLKALLTGGDGRLAAAVRGAIRRAPPATIAGRIAAVLRVDVASELSALSCPVLYLQARRDRLVSLGCASRIQALRPSTELAIIDAPHLLLQANPSAAWSVVGPFLERLAVRDG
jgi:pimeloyl-ACP methyl ester carboxylesterase